MKKSISIVIWIGFLAWLVSACGHSPSSPSPTAAPVSPQPVVTPPSDTDSEPDGGDYSRYCGGKDPVHVYRAQVTGYYPHDDAMEGGQNDIRGKALRTLEAYLRGDGGVSYVSVAMDTHFFKYGTRIRIPEFEDLEGTQIDFRIVDTGSHFLDHGPGRIDICHEDYRSAVDSPLDHQYVTVLVCR